MLAVGLRGLFAVMTVVLALLAALELSRRECLGPGPGEARVMDPGVEEDDRVDD